MEKYKVDSIAHSIVEPDMVDVGLAQNRHFAKALRVSNKLRNVVLGAECIMHHNMVGVPIAYSFGNEMHLVNVPETRRDARAQIAMMMGLIHGSTDRFRFYMAMRAALKNHGARRGLLPTTNMMRLGMLQGNTKGR